MQLSVFHRKQRVSKYCLSQQNSQEKSGNFGDLVSIIINLRLLFENVITAMYNTI